MAFRRVETRKERLSTGDQQIRLEERLAAFDYLYKLSWALYGGRDHALQRYDDPYFDEATESQDGTNKAVKGYWNYLHFVSDTIAASQYRAIVGSWIPSDKNEADFRKNFLEAVSTMDQMTTNAIVTMQSEYTLPNEETVNLIAQYKDWFNQCAWIFGKKHEEIKQTLVRSMTKSSRMSEDQFLNLIMSILFAKVTPETHSYDNARYIVNQQLENNENIISTMGEYPGLQDRVFAAVNEKLDKDWAQRRARDERERARIYFD